MKRLTDGLKKYGFSGVIKRLPRFLRSRWRRFLLHPSFLTRYGISRRRWEKVQVKHELDFWADPAKHDSLDGFTSFKEKYFQRNKNKFTNILLDFPGATMVDIACGPDSGLLPFARAKYKFGIDPLAKEYAKQYPVDPDIIMLAAMAENIPLLSASVDVVYCINALDHFMKPQEALTEMYRILKPGGYFAFSTDVGGTKKHPIKIYEKDLNRFFADHHFKIIEKRCSPHKSAWGEEAGIPLYVFQGYKL